MSLSRHLAAQWTKTRFQKPQTLNFQFPTPPRVLKIFTNGHLQSLHLSSGYKQIEPFFRFLASFMKKKFVRKMNFRTPKNTIFCEL